MLNRGWAGEPALVRGGASAAGGSRRERRQRGDIQLKCGTICALLLSLPRPTTPLVPLQLPGKRQRSPPTAGPQRAANMAFVCSARAFTASPCSQRVSRRPQVVVSAQAAAGKTAAPKLVVRVAGRGSRGRLHRLATLADGWAPPIAPCKRSWEPLGLGRERRRLPPAASHTPLRRRLILLPSRRRLRMPAAPRARARSGEAAAVPAGRGPGLQGLDLGACPARLQPPMRGPGARPTAA